MRSLQAHSRTAACPLLAYAKLKSIIMLPAKLVVCACIEVQSSCRYPISHLILGKIQVYNTQNQNY